MHLNVLVGYIRLAYLSFSFSVPLFVTYCDYLNSVMGGGYNHSEPFLAINSYIVYT